VLGLGVSYWSCIGLEKNSYSIQGLRLVMDLTFTSDVAISKLEGTSFGGRKRAPPPNIGKQCYADLNLL